MVRRAFALVACGFLFSLTPLAQEAEHRLTPGSFKQPATVIAGPDTVFRMLRLPEQDAQRLATKWRGGLEIFQTVAPAVVVVRTDSGHGSGFLLGDGLIVTNHHVVASGLRHDSVKGASYALVHMGRLGTDGTMTLLPDALRAYLYKTDPTRDLAVLRVADRAPGAPPLPRLTLADAAPRPGQDCAIIGHPSSGMLWTMRPCQVAAVGQLPADLVNVVMLKLASSGDEREQVAAQLRRLPSRRIILTSAGANPGDSGGPVVDEHGRVIAVTFGGPGKAEEAKFTYHVHLDELRAMLADVPKMPMFLRPDPWALGPRVELRDLDGDNRPDVLLAGAESPETMLFDLDNDTPAGLWRDAEQLVSDKKWDFEVGVVTSDGAPAAFYDTDNDGIVDLILSGKVDGAMVDGRFVRSAAGKWTYESGLKLPLLSGRYLKTPALAARADRVIRAVLEKN